MMTSMAERILVVGGAGYIGSNVTERLVRKGHEVTVFDNLTYGQRSLARVQQMLDGASLENALMDRSPQAQPRDFQFVQADTRDREKTKEVIKRGFNYVFHFGELVGISACESNPKITREVNFDGSKNVVDAVLVSPNQPRLVWNSSSSVYHISPDGTDFTEASSLPPVETLDNYCQNKVLVEQYIQQQLEAHQGFQAIILRPATVGGLSPRPRIELLPNHIIYSLMTTGKFALARGEDKRAVIDINDITDFLTMLVNSNTWQNGIYNIGHLNESKGWFVRGVCKLLDLDPQEAISEVAQVGDLRNLTIDSSLIHTTLGYSSTHGLRDLVGPIALLLGKDISVFAQNPDDLLLVKDEFTNTPPAEFKKLLSVT